MPVFDRNSKILKFTSQLDMPGVILHSCYNWTCWDKCKKKKTFALSCLEWWQNAQNNSTVWELYLVLIFRHYNWVSLLYSKLDPGNYLGMKLQDCDWLWNVSGHVIFISTATSFPKGAVLKMCCFQRWVQILTEVLNLIP